MALGKNSSVSKTGRTIVLILAGAALGTLMGFGVSKYSELLKPLVQPLIKLDFPLNTYLDFFFLSFSFGFTLNISASTLIGGFFGYWIASRW
ncbi:MAG: hypothetical protein M0Z55_03360 [Peptococcaceae bacterium]|nr:hypothetical protein [Peptococcaceae bacterium]